MLQTASFFKILSRACPQTTLANATFFKINFNPTTLRNKNPRYDTDHQLASNS